jgi:hypothetical protein
MVTVLGHISDANGASNMRRESEGMGSMQIRKNELTEDGGIRYIWVDLPREFEKCYVIPLADCHCGAREFEEKRFRGYLKWIADTPEAVCFFNGDLCNCGLPGTVDSDFWDQSPMTPQDQIRYLSEIVKEYEIEDKILGVVGGSNHPARARKLTGHDYDREFAEHMGVEKTYAKDGAIWLIRVGHWTQKPIGKKASQKPSAKQQIPYLVFATHGWSGGRLAGASMNSARELGAIWLSDAYLVSHRHLDSVTPDLFYVPNYNHPTIDVIRRMYVTSGSFLKYGGYALRKGLRPTPCNTPRLRLDGRRKDLHVSI